MKCSVTGGTLLFLILTELFLSMDEKIKDIVRKECGEDDYKYHVAIVVKYANILADKLGADKEIVELVRELGGRETSTIIAYGGKVPSVDAAMVNGAMANAGEFDHVYDEAPCHPACTVVPASFAIAEQVKGVSGRELITAVTAGIDIVCRMTLATRLPSGKSGWER